MTITLELYRPEERTPKDGANIMFYVRGWWIKGYVVGPRPTWRNPAGYLPRDYTSDEVACWFYLPDINLEAATMTTATNEPSTHAACGAIEL